MARGVLSHVASCCHLARMSAARSSGERASRSTRWILRTGHPAAGATVAPRPCHPCVELQGRRGSPPRFLCKVIWRNVLTGWRLAAASQHEPGISVDGCFRSGGSRPGEVRTDQPLAEHLAKAGSIELQDSYSVRLREATRQRMACGATSITTSRRWTSCSRHRPLLAPTPSDRPDERFPAPALTRPRNSDGGEATALLRAAMGGVGLPRRRAVRGRCPRPTPIYQHACAGFACSSVLYCVR